MSEETWAYEANLFEELTEFMSERDMGFDERIERVLQLGCERLGLRFGICSSIVGGTYTIEHAWSSHEPIEIGSTYDLSMTYCESVVSKGGMVVCAHMSQDPKWSRHPAYMMFELEAYIGVGLKVGGELIGTMNFSSPHPRRAFSPIEVVWVQTMAHWISYAREREHGEWRQERIMELSVDPGCALDADGVVLHANGGFEEVLGVEPRELEGKPLTDALLESDQAAMASAIRNAWDDGARVEVGTRWMYRDGSMRWLDWRFKAAAGRLHATARDVTSLKMAQAALVAARDEAEGARRAQSAFLSNVSHELRTPLNGMLGMAVLLSETKLNDTQRNYVRTIQSSASALNALVDDVLDLSKLEAEAVNLKYEPFEVRAFIEDTALLCAPTAQGKNLGLSWTMAAGTPRKVISDPVRLRQVLLNLTHNAVKFTDEGQVVLGVSCESTTEGECLIVEVRDTGPGVAPEERDRLFEPFSQLDATASKRNSGTGLGLSICMQLVKAMGGTIEVDSVFGEGATFRVTVPVDVVLEQTSEAEEMSVCALVVDDDATRAAPLIEVANQSGVRVEHAKTSRQAKEALAERRFDVVFVDAEMEERYEVFDAIEAAGSRPRVLLVAPMGETSGLVLFKTDGVIERPVRETTLRRTLSELEGELAGGLSEVITIAMNSDEISDIEIHPTLAFRDNSGAFFKHDMMGVTATHQDYSFDLKPRVLLVEDNHVNQQVAVAFLRHLGYEADVVGDGEGALELFDAERHLVILMDCQLPGIDGYETTRRLRRRGVNVPIVALTAYALESERAKAFQVGMDDHLTKPLDRDQLSVVLARWTADPTDTMGEDGQTEVELSPHDIVDSEAMDKLIRDCDGDQEFVEELITSWLQDVAGRLHRLEQLTRATPIDYKEVHREAHTIKGSALVFGLSQVVESAESLEQDAKASTGDLPAGLGNLRDRVAIGEIRLRELIS